MQKKVKNILHWYGFILIKLHLKYEICIKLLYCTSLGRFSFQRYNGFSLNLIFQKIHKLEVFLMFLIAAKLYLTKRYPILIIFGYEVVLFLINFFD